MYLKNSLRAGAISLAVAACLSLHALASQGPAPAAPSDSASVVRLPMRMEGAYAVVDVTYPGREAPLRMVVDTAAGATVLDRALARELQIEQADVAVVGGASGSAEFARAKQTSLQIGDHRMVVQPVLHDMAVFSKGERRYDGILGNDILRRFDVRFDFPGGELTVAPPDTHPEWFGSSSCQASAGAVPGFGFVELELSSHGKTAKVRAVVDTGAAQTVLNPKALAALGRDFADPSLRIHDNGTKGIDGAKIETRLLDLDRLGIERWERRNIEVRVSDLPVFRALSMSDTPAAILGIDALADTRLSMSADTKTTCME